MTIRFTRGLAAVPIATAMLGSMPAQAKNDNFTPVPTIAFTNTIPNMPGPEDDEQVFNSAEIYLIDPDGTNPRKLTDNQAADVFASLSADGKKIVFDSNRNRGELEPLNTSDLFLMETDGSGQTFLTRGSSATWSPDSKNIAFHASVSGIGAPIRPDPGAPTADSDIFVANVDDLLDGVETPRNITNTPDHIDDDPHWSPDGVRIVYSRYDILPVGFSTSDIYVLNADGTGLTQLTDTARNERSPEWSPDGNRIVYMCPSNVPTIMPFEICVINTDGTNKVQLTNNNVNDLGPHWSPDGQHIVFQRALGGGSGNQLFVINADGTESQITGVRPDDEPQGSNGWASWDLLRVKADS